MTGGIEDTDRRDANRRSTAVMSRRNARRIPGLMKFPERLHARMHALRASEHFTTDRRMRNVALGDDGSRDGKSPLRVVRGFADPPLAFRIAHVSRNDRAGRSFEASDALRIPALHVVAREHLGLF